MIIDPTELETPLKEEGIQIRMGDHLIEGDILIGIEEERGYPGGGPPDVEDPMVPLMVGGLPMMEDPLMEMEDPLDPQVDRDHQVLKDLPDQ